MRMQKMLVVGFIVSTFIFALSTTASAHVTVKPAEVVTAGYQTFTINVPNEKPIPTTSVKLLIPVDIKAVTPTQKAGWQITTEKEGSGEAAVTNSITWSGGSIGNGLRDEFTFTAKVPDQAMDIQWKSYQTYSDGSVVSWDKEAEGGHGAEGNSSGPFSITKVAQEVPVSPSNQAAADAKKAADRAMYIAVAGTAVGLIGVALATRKK